MAIKKMIKNKISLEDYKKMQLCQKANKYHVSDKSERTWTGYYLGRDQTIVFDSKKEMRRFQNLLVCQEYGEITSLHLQEKFIIGLDPITIYIADFLYFDPRKRTWVVEEVKGFWTEIAKKKKRLFQQKYPDIEFVEI